MKKTDSIDIDKEIKSVMVGVDIAIEAFNNELNKTKLKKFHKNLLRECFALGLTSAILIRMKKIISEIEKGRKK